MNLELYNSNAFNYQFSKSNKIRKNRRRESSRHESKSAGNTTPVEFVLVPYDAISTASQYLKIKGFPFELLGKDVLRHSQAEEEAESAKLEELDCDCDYHLSGGRGGKESSKLLDSAMASTCTAKYLGYANEVLTRFGISQIALKLCDKGLQIATQALEKSPPLKPVVNWIQYIRRNALGDPSLLGGMAEVLGVNMVLSVVGLQLVPVNHIEMDKSEDTTEKGEGKSEFEDSGLGAEEVEDATCLEEADESKAIEKAVLATNKVSSFMCKCGKVCG